MTTDATINRIAVLGQGYGAQSLTSAFTRAGFAVRRFGRDAAFSTGRASPCFMTSREYLAPQAIT